MAMNNFEMENDPSDDYIKIDEQENPYCSLHLEDGARVDSAPASPHQPTESSPEVWARSRAVCVVVCKFLVVLAFGGATAWLSWWARGQLATCARNKSGSDLLYTISVSNGNPWGEWAPSMDFCSKNSHAVGFKLKIEDPQGFGDDSGLNAIQLICDYGSGPSSDQGPWGEWRPPLSCKESSYLVAFQLRAEAWQGAGDDTAADNINFLCRDMNNITDVTILRGNHSNGWGELGDWSSFCPGRTAICGIQTRVEDYEGGGDDSALNDVKFTCCSFI